MFNGLGVNGLKNKQPPGRPSRIDARILIRIKNDIKRHPGTFGYRQSNWDGVLLSKHLVTVYGIKLGMRQIQRVLRML